MVADRYEKSIVEFGSDRWQLKGIKFGEADLISSSKGTQRNFGESKRNSEVAVEAAV